MKKTDHYVMMIVDKAGLTEEMRASFTGLNAWCRENIPGCISEKIMFLEQDDASTVGISLCIVFDGEEAKDAFRTSQMHIDHVNRVKPIVKQMAVYDL